MPADHTILSTVETPRVLLDYDRLVANIRWMQQIADTHGVALRPHIKTHKCLEIARLQMEAGAVGITAAKTEEALKFMADGIRSVTLAHPLVSAVKIDRLLTAARTHGTELRFIVDSMTGIQAMATAARRHQTTLHLFLKIDVGLHRCGVREEDPRLLPLVRRIEEDPSLRFVGLLSHAGHAYGAKDREGVRAVAREECAILNRVRQRLEEAGIRVAEVSVGSTPTAIASDAYEGITEIRPGNYVFLDRMPLGLGLIDRSQIALSVLAMVVSANDEYLIIDAGSKVLSSDLGPHGMQGIEGYGVAYPVADFDSGKNGLTVVRLSEEHGFLRRNGFDLPVGSLVRILPNHACVVANLADHYLVLGKEATPVQWPVVARALVR